MGLMQEPTAMLRMDPQDVLRLKLETLVIEHRRLDEEIQRLAEGGGFVPMEVVRLKKQKLALKDQISSLKDRLEPDIIA